MADVSPKDLALAIAPGEMIEVELLAFEQGYRVRAELVHANENGIVITNVFGSGVEMPFPWTDVVFLAPA